MYRAMGYLEVLSVGKSCLYVEERLLAMSEGRKLEKLFERIRFLRDRQRFFEGFASASFIVSLLTVRILWVVGVVLTMIIAIATVGWIYTERSIREVWVEVLKDPKKLESVPWLMIACLVGTIAITILAAISG